MTDDTKVTEKVMFGKKECPHCKGMVSAKPGPYQVHLNRCQASVKTETQLEEQSFKSDLSNVTDKDILKTLVEAQKIQASMLKAPEAITADMTEDVNYKLRKRYAPETIERFDDKGRPLHTHTAYFGDANEQRMDIARGYVPVINEGGTFVVNQGGDILYTRPMELTHRVMRSFEMESESRVVNISNHARTVSSAKGIEAPSIHEGEIQEEELAMTGSVTLPNE